MPITRVVPDAAALLPPLGTIRTHSLNVVAEAVVNIVTPHRTFRAVHVTTALAATGQPTTISEPTPGTIRLTWAAPITDQIFVTIVAV